MTHTRPFWHGGDYAVALPDLRTHLESFTFLTALAHELDARAPARSVDVRLHQLRWIDANMCAPLGAILYRNHRAGRGVRLLDVQPHIDAILRKNGFLSFFASERRTKDKWGTVIPFRRYLSSEERSFPNYVARLSKDRDRLQFTHRTRNAMMFNVLELFNNAVYHAESVPGIFVCGQYYPNANKLRFSIADLGQGVQGSVTRYLSRAVGATEAIEWAVVRGHSTWRDGPGGLGLAFLREYVQANGGVSQIVSGQGLVEYREGMVLAETLPRAYPGTCVSIELNTNTDVPYLVGHAAQDDGNLF